MQVSNGMLHSIDENSVKNALIDNKKDCHDSPMNKLELDYEKRRRDFRFNVERALKGIGSLPNNWDDLSSRKQRNWIRNRQKAYYTNIPKSLLFLTVGSLVNGEDYAQKSLVVPEWLDRDKFQRGQRFAMDNYTGVSLAEMLSLFMLFSFKNLLKPIIVTGKSSEPFTAFRRYLSMRKRVRNWYTSDVWTEGTEAHKDMETVRKMHEDVRKKMEKLSNDEIDETARISDWWSVCNAKILQDFRDAFQPPLFGQCPYMLSDEETFKRSKSFNQGDMASTQFGFMALVILYPQKLGIHGVIDEDLDAYCHVWRGLGYLLGIEDEFNFCRGTLEEIKQRSRDYIEYWVKPNFREISPEWEHMMRCIIEGVAYYLPKVTYERSLLYLADVIDIRMPRMQESLSYTDRICLNIHKFTFNWIARLPGFPTILNRRLIKRSKLALQYSEEELAMLRKKSEITLAKGVAETIAIKDKDSTITASIPWHQNSLLVFLSSLFILNFPFVVKEYCKKFFIVGTHSTTQLYNSTIL